MFNRTFQLASMTALLLTLGAAGPVNTQTASPQPSTTMASPVEGPLTTRDHVNAYDSWVRWIDLRGDEVTLISLTGSAITDLDLFIYDAAGNLVIASESVTSEEAVLILPFRTGRFYIEVRNLGNRSNPFSLDVE